MACFTPFTKYRLQESIRKIRFAESNQIDKPVYELYEPTTTEITIVEGRKL
jgi:hypothetical protein